jgi:hypothetical protein
MFSFTTLKYEFRRYKSSIELCCGSCNRPISINDNLYYIEGERNYEKLCFNKDPDKLDWIIPPEMKPFIPREIKKTLSRDLDVSSWRDSFSIKACHGCAIRLLRFTQGTLIDQNGHDVNLKQPFKPNLVPTIFLEGQTYKHAPDRFTFRWYNSLKDYNCDMNCKSEIKRGDHYMRKGDYLTYCAKCSDRIKPFIGNVASYAN